MCLYSSPSSHKLVCTYKKIIGSHLYYTILLLFIGVIPPKSGTLVTRKASIMKANAMRKRSEKEEEEEVKVEMEEEVEEEMEEVLDMEVVEYSQRKMSTHSIRRNGGEYRSFVSDDRFEVINLLLVYMYMLLNKFIASVLLLLLCVVEDREIEKKNTCTCKSILFIYYYYY